jgi:hypothetical protein
LIGDRQAAHGSDIASVASRAVLERPGRGGCDRGRAQPEPLAPQSGDSRPVNLSQDDFARINAVLARANPVPGDVYALERDRSGKHGSVMKYNLNKEGH